MATALQMAANRRNAQKSTGPRTPEGKAAVRLNAVTHGMTAKSVLIPYESAADYSEIRASLIQDYAPATSQELMLVDQIAAGYWRTIRSRRYEAEMFDNRLRVNKRKFGMDMNPDPKKDDQGCVVALQLMEPEMLHNYLRYDGAISRDYYRAIAALERMQAARRREEDRRERKARQEAEKLDHIVNHPDPDTVAEISSEPPPPRQAGPEPRVLSAPCWLQAEANTGVDLTGFVSYPQTRATFLPANAR
jgi:hypothetical protein